MNDSPVIVSACLVGIKCRYDGGDSYDKELVNSGQPFIPVCPEQLAGLPTPRAKAEIAGGGGGDGGPEVLVGRARVLDSNGNDLTARFIAGAEEVLKIMRLTNARRAVLKEKSPSCGVAKIKREGKRVKGMGVLAALLKREGIEVEGI